MTSTKVEAAENRGRSKSAPNVDDVPLAILSGIGFPQLEQSAPPTALVEHFFIAYLGSFDPIKKNRRIQRKTMTMLCLSSCRSRRIPWRCSASRP